MTLQLWCGTFRVVAISEVTCYMFDLNRENEKHVNVSLAFVTGVEPFLCDAACEKVK
ncbi:hypothetical protein [Bacillus thuringiensis]|uniref:hypothetical protein n=1 Tax=Bacillus thuringiensis TaxID=1428 RepID=UPI0013E38FE2|nr:hypothetical protein [Bacillus thuringiensis]